MMFIYWLRFARVMSSVATAVLFFAACTSLALGDLGYAAVILLFAAGNAWCAWDSNRDLQRRLAMQKEEKPDPRSWQAPPQFPDREMLP